ncbi:MAG: hypothetical protein IPM35_01615 [Myxococcales bacterium]|nr:hypothetical protein [Myxococcales bacterium]
MRLACASLLLLACEGPANDGPGRGLHLVSGDAAAKDATSELPPGTGGGGGNAFECNALDATTETVICGCTLSQAEDHTAENEVTVKFTGKYLPRCLAVKAGTSVTWTGNFAAHPLSPSACAGDVERNPIHDVSDPLVTSLSIAFPEAGLFPYFCPDHASDTPSPGGMCGVVYVLP